MNQVAEIGIEWDLIARCLDEVEESIVSAHTGEAFDVIKTALQSYKMACDSGWTSAQIGALMIAATLATDAVESMWSSENNGPMPDELAKQVAEWRRAVERR